MHLFITGPFLRQSGRQTKSLIGFRIEGETKEALAFLGYYRERRRIACLRERRRILLDSTLPTKILETKLQSLKNPLPVLTVSPKSPQKRSVPAKKSRFPIESLLRIVQIYNQMSLQKIILSRKKSISDIIQSCDAHSKVIFRKVNRLELPRLHQSCSHNPQSKHIEDDQTREDHPLSLPKAKLRPGKLIDLSYSIQKAQFDKKRVKVQPFCASVHVSRPNKDLFRHVIHKYKRNFHPSNASKGERNTSNDPIIKTPRKIRQLRERYHTQQNQTELRRMAVLNQVINENNRKEIRLRRQKSLVRHKLIQ